MSRNKDGFKMTEKEVYECSYCHLLSARHDLCPLCGNKTMLKFAEW